MKGKSLKAIKQKRDGSSGAIAVLPHVVLKSPAYLTLSAPAKVLLVDLAMQYNTSNNGALLASWRYMSQHRGWTSAAALHKAKKELIEHGLIVETVKGHRPNKASLYGLTYLALDDIQGLEISVQEWPRGAYARWKPPETKTPKRSPPPPETREAHYQRLREKYRRIYPYNG
jgi:hypothetical protein